MQRVNWLFLRKRIFDLLSQDCRISRYLMNREPKKQTTLPAKDQGKDE